jgi:hypothetical protein
VPHDLSISRRIVEAVDTSVTLTPVRALTAFNISALGQKRRFDRLPFTSGLPPSTDVVGVRRHVANNANTGKCRSTNRSACLAL